MNIIEMLERLKLHPKRIFETNNGDLVGLFGENILQYSDGCQFTITEYALNNMTFTEFWII